MRDSRIGASARIVRILAQGVARRRSHRGHAETLRERGVNLVRGAMHSSADLQRLLRNERSEAAKAFEPGKTVALTEGVVVKRTELAEIVQYSPTTESAPVSARKIPFPGPRDGEVEAEAERPTITNSATA